MEPSITKRYWYVTCINLCPVCGGKDSDTYKERRYTEKPKEPEDRIEYSKYYDGCMDEEFM
jgi:hypothetical protein